MIGKNNKTTFFYFLPYECEAAEEYLEEMAEKGWLLQSINGAFLKFKKVKPEKIKYSVDVFNKISQFDHKDSDVALEYREYCQAAGWNYICQKGKALIFYTEDYEKTISIHTDNEEKFKSVFKASLYDVGIQLFLILIFIFNLYMQLFFGATDFALGTNLGILSIVAMFSIIIINSIEIVSFFLWTIKARCKLKVNKFMPYNNYKQLKTKNILKITYALIILLILLKITIFDNQGSNKFTIFLLVITCIPIIILACVEKMINKNRYSKNTNIVISIVSTIVSIYLVLMLVGFTAIWSITAIGQRKVSTEKVNLSLLDFGYKEDKDTSPYISLDKSILAKRIRYSCSCKDNNLIYTILQSQYPWVIKFDEDRLLSKFNKYGIILKQQDTNLPSNIKVYSGSKEKNFVLVSQDKVADFTKGFSNIDENQFLSIVYNKLLN